MPEDGDQVFHDGKIGKQGPTDEVLGQELEPGLDDFGNPVEQGEFTQAVQASSSKDRGQTGRDKVARAFSQDFNPIRQAVKALLSAKDGEFEQAVNELKDQVAVLAKGQPKAGAKALHAQMQADFKAGLGRRNGDLNGHTLNGNGKH